MLTGMIARDVVRNRTVTVVLAVLMTLSVVLATASAGTLVRLGGGSSQLLAGADAPHVVQMHAGEYNAAEVERWAAARDDVAHHQAMLMLGIDGANLLFDGAPQTSNIQQNALVVPNEERDLLLGPDNEPVTVVEPGTIVLPVIYEIEQGLEVGDQVAVTAPDGFVKRFTIAAFARDSIMNPAIASSKRLAVAPADLLEVQQHTGTQEHLISFWLNDPGTQMAAFKKAYQDAGLPQAGQMVDSGTFRILTMIGDGMVAGVVILVSMLLLLVGMLSLRFSFVTAAEQDYREIGVLKALGVAPRDIKGLYLVKYAALAGVATVLGLAGGLALTPLLTRNITRYMGSVSGPWPWVVPALVALGVLGLLILFVLTLLRRFNRITAVEALGAGVAMRERRWPRPRPRLHRSRAPVHVRLGVMDVMARANIYLILLLVFAVSTFITIVPVNSATTVNDPAFITYMGTGPVDLRLDLLEADQASADDFERVVDRLAADEDVATFTAMVTTRNDTVDRDGNAISLYVENGDHGQLPLTYAEGRAPTNQSEIALSLLALNESGRKVDDTLPVTVGGAARDLRIVGTYQDITNGGKTAKGVLPTAGEDVVWYMAGVVVAPGVDPAVFAEELSAELAPVKVADIQQWTSQTLGPIADQMVITAAVSAVVAIALAVLMTALFTRMLLSRDIGQIAIQRAVGADDAGLRAQYLTRILLVLAVGVVLGTVAAATLGQGAFNALFEGIFGGFEYIGQGTSRITFAVNPLLAYVALPVVLLLSVTAATSVISARSIPDATIATLNTE